MSSQERKDSAERRLPGIYPMEGYYIGLTKQGGLTQEIAVGARGAFYFVSVWAGHFGICLSSDLREPWEREP